MKANAKNLIIGWGECEVTPDKPVVLGSGGLSKGVQDPLMVAAMAISSADSNDCAVFVSCDNGGIPTEKLKKCRESIKTRIPELDARKLIPESVMKVK